MVEVAGGGTAGSPFRLRNLLPVAEGVLCLSSCVFGPIMSESDSSSRSSIVADSSVFLFPLRLFLPACASAFRYSY